MSTKQKKTLLRIVVSFLIFAVSGLLLKDYWQLGGFIIAYLLIAYDVILKAITNIGKQTLFDEHFLMTLATFGALFTGEYAEAFVVMWLYQIGELLQDYAVDKSRKSIAALMEIAPDYANLVVDDKVEEVDPEDVEIGSKILIKVGEKVPLDCIVLSGTTSLNTAALTGESLPVEVHEGDEILSGTINLRSPIYAKTLKEYDDSAVARILDLVENASDKKAKTENFITKFARYYTPIVVFLALALAVIPPLFNGEWVNYLHRACAFLVISCPCALVISVPLTFFSSIGSAGKLGILVKGSNYLEVLAKTNTVAFDKTGTLTEGVLNLSGLKAVNGDEKELLYWAALAEGRSNHPIALALQKKSTAELPNDVRYEEIAGRGIIAHFQDHEVLAGNELLLTEHHIETVKVADWGTIVHIALDQKYLGYLLFRDVYKKDAKDLIASLNAQKIKTVILSGDQKAYVDEVAKELKVSEAYAELLPEDKVKTLEGLLNDQGATVYVGDGINDAPSLMRSDVGIAMGALGSDAAIEVSDVVIVDDSLTKVSKAIKIAKKTVTIAWENIIFALGVKFAVLVLGAFGIVSMWIAIFADVGVTCIAVINAMRAMRLDR